MIDHLQTQGEWEIQLTMAIDFISSKDSDETRTMHTKSDSKEILIRNETYEVITEFFDSLLQKYKKDLKELMKESELIFNSVDLLYNKCHKIGLVLYSLNSF